MITREQMTLTSTDRTYLLTKLKWGGAITAGIPKAVVNTATSALAGEASLMLPANNKRRPAPDMFPGVLPGARIKLEVFIDEIQQTSIPLVITDVVFTEDSVEIDFSTNSLSLSAPVRVAPIAEYMPQGWGRGDGDTSERWARGLGGVQPGTSPGHAAFWAMRAAGYHIVPPYHVSNTIIDCPMQWTAMADSWNPNTGHTIASSGNEDLMGKPGMTYEDGMTYISSGRVWLNGTIEGRRNWGKVYGISGHFMVGAAATDRQDLLLIFGGGNWVSIGVGSKGDVGVNTSEGSIAHLPRDAAPPGSYVQFAINSTAGKWWVKVAGQRIDGTFVPRPENNTDNTTEFTGSRLSVAPGGRVAGLQVRTTYNDTSHYLDSLLDTSGRYIRTGYIEIPLAMMDSQATPSVRDQSARDVMNDIAEAICASWWIDEDGHCQFRDMKALAEGPMIRSYNFDSDVSTYQLSGEDTANRDAVQVKYSAAAVSKNQQPRVKVYEGRGATISPEDRNDELITPREGNEWLSTDWSLSFYKPGVSDLSALSWYGVTRKEGTGSTRQSMEFVNPWTSIFKAWVADGASDDFSAQYEVDKNKFPLVQARGFIQFTPTSKRYGSSTAISPFVHEGGQWVTSSVVADRIGNYLLNLSTNPIPMRSLTVFYSPKTRLGDVIMLSPGSLSHTTRKLLVTQVEHEPSELRTKLQVVEISSTDRPEFTWVQAQGNAIKAQTTHQTIEDARNLAGANLPTWAQVEADNTTYPYGI